MKEYYSEYEQVNGKDTKQEVNSSVKIAPQAPCKQACKQLNGGFATSVGH